MNCLNSLIVNSGPLSLWIISSLFWVANQLFNAFITVLYFFVYNSLHPTIFVKLVKIVNRNLYFLLATALDCCIRSIWNLRKSLKLLMWFWIFPLLTFPTEISQICYINKNSLTSGYICPICILHLLLRLELGLFLSDLQFLYSNHKNNRYLPFKRNNESLA